MIQLSGAGKRFGHKLLFENLNWLITSKDRAGLVGANGTGKTTLLKTLAGIESLEYGSLSVTRGTSTGYLPQDGLSLSGRSVLRRMHVGVFLAATDGAGDGRADATRWRRSIPRATNMRR